MARRYFIELHIASFSNNTIIETIVQNAFYLTTQNKSLLSMIKVVSTTSNKRNEQLRRKFNDEYDYDGFVSAVLDFLKPVMRNLPDPRLNAASKYSRDMILRHALQSKTGLQKYTAAAAAKKNTHEKGFAGCANHINSSNVFVVVVVY